MCMGGARRGAVRWLAPGCPRIMALGLGSHWTVLGLLLWLGEPAAAQST
eukprot:COSAG01_NODE_23093_length_828_cov_3.122085_1_plen_48_part_10